MFLVFKELAPSLGPHRGAVVSSGETTLLRPTTGLRKPLHKIFLISLEGEQEALSINIHAGTFSRS